MKAQSHAKIVKQILTDCEEGNEPVSRIVGLIDTALVCLSEDGPPVEARGTDNREDEVENAEHDLHHFVDLLAQSGVAARLLENTIQPKVEACMGQRWKDEKVFKRYLHMSLTENRIDDANAGEFGAAGAPFDDVGDEVHHANDAYEVAGRPHFSD